MDHSNSSSSVSETESPPVKSRRSNDGSKRQKKKLLNQEYHNMNGNEFYASIIGKPTLHLQIYDYNKNGLKKYTGCPRFDEQCEEADAVVQNTYYLDHSSLILIKLCETYKLDEYINLKSVCDLRLDALLGWNPDPFYASKIVYTTTVFTENEMLAEDCDITSLLPYISIPGRPHVVIGTSARARFLLKFCEAKIEADSNNNNKEMASKLKSLLGHKEACLKACAEVSSWTRFCEYDIIEEMYKEMLLGCVLKMNNRNLEATEADVPKTLLQFEYHLQHPAKYHCSQVPKSSKKSKPGIKEDVEVPTSSSTIQPEHLYAEGENLTLSDLVLYPTVALYMQIIESDSAKAYLPNVLAWCDRVPAAAGYTKDVGKLRYLVVPAMPLAHRILNDDNNITKKSLYKMDVQRERKTKASAADVKAAFDAFECACTKLVEYCSSQMLNLDPLYDWESAPELVNPGIGGQLPIERRQRKNQQVSSMIQMVQFVYNKVMEKRKDTGNQSPVRVADFCSGGGHVGIAVAHLFPDCQVYLIENKGESLRRAWDRIERLGLGNITIVQGNLTSFVGSFDIGCALHACGSATDLVLDKCRQMSACFVVSPCCYNTLEPSENLDYPRSDDWWDDYFLNLPDLFSLSDNYLTLAHVAEQTNAADSDNSSIKQEQAQLAMRIIDSDRLHYVQHSLKPNEPDYQVWIKQMEPPTASPKNHILVGFCDKEPRLQLYINRMLAVLKYYGLGLDLVKMICLFSIPPEVDIYTLKYAPECPEDDVD